MTHTYANNDAHDYETLDVRSLSPTNKEVQHQHPQAPKPIGKHEFGNHIYDESTTDSCEKPNIRPARGGNLAKNITTTSSKCPENFLQSQKMLITIAIMVCAVFILAVVGVVFGILNFTKNVNVNQEVQQTTPLTNETTSNTSEPQITKPPLGTFPIPARSCIELNDAGFSDGIYVIQPSEKRFEVYCDMTAAGGGWVLAATINNIDFSTTERYDDSWFLTTSNNDTHVMDYQSWMNTNVFGKVETCTQMDYKSQAYYEYQGSDVMIRHVPNYTPVDVSREQSFLQYQTDNGFMQNYGGNMHKIFNYHYALKPTKTFYPDVNSMLDRLAARSWEITSLFSDFHFYDYGSSSNTIYDSELFNNNGMQIDISWDQYVYPSEYEAGCYKGIANYEAESKCGLGNMIWSSRKSYPFFFLMAVGNFDGCFQNLLLRVYSERPETDPQETYTGNHTIHNFFLYYEAKCRYGTSFASSCDVWFYVINTETLKSTETPNISPYNLPSTTNYYWGWQVQDPVTNVMFGYTMLSRKNGNLIAETQMKESTHFILDIIAETQQFCPDCSYDDVLSVPVHFSIGDDSVVNSMLPPSVKPLPTGFIQFRAYGSTGSVYAMCPAVKVNDWRSEYVCVGGMNNADSHVLDDRTDFANWDGLPGTTLEELTSVDFAHSRRDLNSTIMIFYR